MRISDWSSDVCSSDLLIAGMLPESKLLPAGTYGFNSPDVSRFTGMMIEPPRLLRALLRDIRLAGGRVVVRDFHTPADITALPEALVFNCTDLGSNRLFGDAELQPMRGQLAVLRPQHEDDYVLATSRGLDMISRRDGIYLGV